MANIQLTRLSNSQTANRIAGAIHDGLRIRDLVSLSHSPYILSKKNDLITWNQLTYESLDLIFKMLELDPLYLLTGQENYSASYTPYDAEVIAALEHMNERQLLHASQIILSLCPYLDQAINLTTKNPTFRLNAYLDSKRWPDCRRDFSTDIFREDSPAYARAVEAYKHCLDVGPKGRLHTDSLPDIAEAVGVSLRWLLGIKAPLFCTSTEASDVFDLYTLMPSDYQDVFYHSVKKFVGVSK